MIYDFDKPVDRKGSNCVKHDLCKVVFGTEDVIPMWVADMDFETPDFIVEVVKQRANHPVYGYHFRGNEYYESVIGWMKRRHQWEVQREWISFTPGIVCGLNMAVMALTEPGDKVLIQTPVYHPFHSAVLDHSRELVCNPLCRTENNYVVDFELFEQQIQSAKLFILCNPHNPLGRCWTREELAKLGEICNRYGVVVVSDEIHSDMMLHGQRHLPFATINEVCAQNSITFNAASKTFNMAGLSTSNVIIINEELRQKFTAFVSAAGIDGGNIFGTVAAQAAYTYGDEWLDQCMRYISDNVDYVSDFLHANLPDIKFVKPDASYLMWLDFSAYGTDDEIWERLVKKAHLGLNRGREFGKEGECHYRINLACQRSVVEKAMQNLKEAFATTTEG